jgi:hypothetical protein
MRVNLILICFSILSFTNLKSQNFENQVSFDLGDSFRLLEKGEARYIYITDKGVSFSMSAKQNVEKPENIPIIAAMGLWALSNELESFEMIYESKEYKLSETIYSFFVYTHFFQEQKLMVYSFHTYFNGKMVNILFTFPDSLQGIWSKKTMEIMNTMKFEKLKEE